MRSGSPAAGTGRECTPPPVERREVDAGVPDGKQAMHEQADRRVLELTSIVAAYPVRVSYALATPAGLAVDGSMLTATGPGVVMASSGAAAAGGLQAAACNQDFNVALSDCPVGQGCLERRPAGAVL